MRMGRELSVKRLRIVLIGDQECQKEFQRVPVLLFLCQLHLKFTVLVMDNIVLCLFNFLKC